jgi:hypothetical protein
MHSIGGSINKILASYNCRLENSILFTLNISYT